jgi:hypothetical protein
MFPEGWARPVSSSNNVRSITCASLRLVKAILFGGPIYRCQVRCNELTSLHHILKCATTTVWGYWCIRPYQASLPGAATLTVQSASSHVLGPLINRRLWSMSSTDPSVLPRCAAGMHQRISTHQNTHHPPPSHRAVHPSCAGRVHSTQVFDSALQRRPTRSRLCTALPGAACYNQAVDLTRLHVRHCLRDATRTQANGGQDPHLQYISYLWKRQHALRLICAAAGVACISPAGGVVA